jgi:uncharacterized protein YfaS (alpha-2-macroglobulin family)
MRGASLRYLCVLGLLVDCSGPAPVAKRPEPPVAPVAPVTAPAPAPLVAGRPIVALTDTDGAGALTSSLEPPKAAAAAGAVTTLSPQETAALIARMEPLPDLATKPAPVMRAPSLMPPPSGGVTPIAFYAPSGTTIADKPVAVVPPVIPPLPPPQILPTGEVAAESEIRVRFDEPMVAVAQIGSAPAPNVTITPALAGTWRWLDTRVATFSPAAGMLPRATEYTVTVAAGARSVTGMTLAEAVTAKFKTRPVVITSLFPRGVKLRPDSALAVEFDQDVDPAAIAKFLRVQTGKTRTSAFRVIDLAEARTLWAKNPALSLDERALSPHHVILAPKTAWPAGIAGRVALAKNAPSQEGPRTTERESDAGFDIAPPFTLLGLGCDNHEARVAGNSCAAGGEVMVTFANDIEIGSYRANKVQIDGLEFADNKPSSFEVPLSIPMVVGRAYGVTIGDGIEDIYGQPFLGPHHASFVTERMHYEPDLQALGGLYVLDPRFTIPQWSVTATAVPDLTVELYKVTPADYFAYEDYESGARKTLPGKRAWSKTYTVGGRYTADARVDLTPALHDGVGHVLVVATAGSRKTHAWIEVTKLAVSTRVDKEKASAWVHDITPAHLLEPIAGAQTSLVVPRASTASAATDTDGHAAFDLPDPRAHDEHGALIVVERGGDSAFAAISPYEKTVRNHFANWYVTDDRFTYKPGEKVYVKGWVRWTHDGVNPDLALPAPGDEIGYTLVDARSNKIASGKAAVTDQGGFDLEVELPANANLGTATFTFTSKNSSNQLPIRIEEFRTPAYAVTLNDDVTHGGATPLVVGESIEMAAEAKYYAGGGLGGSAIRWDATLGPAHYAPPGWDRYTFDPVRPRARRYDRRTELDDQRDSTLSGASNSTVVYAIPSLPGGEPAVLSVDSTVTDIDRYSIRASSRPILVHPSNYYVGLRQQPGHTDAVEVIVTDIDGTALAGVPVEVDVEGVLGSERWRDDAKVIDTHPCKLVSATTPVACEWKRRDLDTAYTATAHVADSRGRPNAAQLAIPWWTYNETKVDFAIIPDRPLYRPGDVAKLEIRSGVVPSTAVVSFTRNGMFAQQRVALTKPSTTVELPIEAAYIQDVHVVVDRYAPRDNGKGRLPLPDHSTAQATLQVDLEAARLVMTAKAQKTVVEPGGKATFEVAVTRDDKPVANAEVALVVVDEAILALSSKSHPDPLAPFYRTLPDGTWETTSLDLLHDAGNELDGKPGFDRYNMDDPTSGRFGYGRSGYGAGGGAVGYGVGGGRGGMRGISGVVTSRKDFRATAVFSPRLHTDANGRVSVTVKMPDSLTRFRVVALATADTRYFGKAEGMIITQRPVNARTVAPRFLTQGDAFALPVVVQNLDTKPRTIDVAVRAANLEQTGPAGKRVTVPAGGRTEVRFDFATRARGRAAVETIAVSGDFADASTIELPVWEPATTEVFATYGVVDDAPKFERLDVPAEIFREVGGVEAEVASTQMQALTDAYWYLYAYPYECAEQRSSRMLATSAMYDILDAFAVPGKPSRAELDAQRTADVQKLTKDQLADGSWGYFAGMRGDSYVTVQVLSALSAQNTKGPVTQRATAYVTKLADGKLALLESAVKTPLRATRDEEPYDVSIAAAALTSLAAAGTDVQSRALRLHAAATALGTYPMDAKARVLALVAKRDRAKVVRKQLVGDILSAAHETAAGATIATSYVESERLLLPSNNKTTALALDALIREAPDEPLVEKLARGLLGARKRGRWLSTQENLAVMQAMRRYFDTYEKDTPNYTGKLWFGTSAYVEEAFSGRSGRRGQARLDWQQLAPGSGHDIALQKTGPGRMYYRIGITYAPKKIDLPPLDAGFVVRRSYEAVDDPKDVTHLPDGTWKIRLGAKVRVVIETLNSTTRHEVAIVDPLPAGLESVNTRLAIAERAAVSLNDDRWDHVEMRDNRSEAFEMTLHEGTHRFGYTARATTPGKFIAAPAKAEEMYSPETFGRSAGTTVTIE